MSASYLLTLSNPDIKPGDTNTQPNTIYTDKQGGNKLDLIITNNSGSKRTIGASSTGQYVTLAISRQIMGDTGANNLIGSGTIDPSWQMAPKFTSDDKYYYFQLIPPSSGLSIENGGTGKISLLDIQPDIKGSGTVMLSYQFDEVNSIRNIPATLITCGEPDEHQHTLVGDSGALRFDFFVNTIEKGPIIVSSQPATDNNKVENRIRFQLVYQAASKSIKADDAGGLVDHWDKTDEKKTPTFRIFFPYSDSAIDSSLEHDLTDCLAPADANYNAITSARNIIRTFNEDDPGNNSTTFWEIDMAGDSKDTSNTPAWAIKPTTHNDFLFTTNASTLEPGPELNAYLISIFSDLFVGNPPDTLLYFQWFNFPGFNDGIQVFSVQKELLAINSYSAKLLREDIGPCIQFDWDTVASSCSVNDDVGYNTTYSFKMSLNLDQQLQTDYTLTAIASNKVSSVSQTFSVGWAINEASYNTQFDWPMKVCTTSDYVLIVDIPMSDNFTTPLYFLDPSSLLHTSVGPINPPDIISDVVVSPDKSTIYITTLENLYGYDTDSRELVPGSGVSLDPGGGFVNNIFFTPGGDNIVVFSFGTAEDNTTIGIITIYKRDGLERINSKIFSWDNYMAAVAPITGNYLLADASTDSLSVLDPQTFEHVEGSPVSGLLGIGEIVVSPDEESIYVLSLALPENGVLTKIDAKTLKIVKQVNVPILWNCYYYVFFDITTSPLLLSGDGKQLFLSGIDGKAFSDSHNIVPLFMVFDADTLEQPDWATKIQVDKNVVASGMAFSAGGDRIYVTAMDNLLPPVPGMMYTVDAYLPA